MLTLFHGQKFLHEIDGMDIPADIKECFQKLVNEFLKDLFELAEFDPSKEYNAHFKSTIINAQ